MKFKNALLIAAFAVSLTLAVILFARSSRPPIAEGVPGDFVRPSSPSGPVLAGGLAGGILGDKALTGSEPRTVPMTRSGGGTDQGE